MLAPTAPAFPTLTYTGACMHMHGETHIRPTMTRATVPRPTREQLNALCLRTNVGVCIETKQHELELVVIGTPLHRKFQRVHSILQARERALEGSNVQRYICMKEKARRS